MHVSATQHYSCSKQAKELGMEMQAVEGGEDQQHCPTLTSDAIYEILSRVPSSSLPDIQCVCKEWKQVSEDPSFRPLHSIQTNLISGCLVETTYNHIHSTSFVPFHSPTTPSPLITLDFIPRSVRILAVADRRGILCCTTTDCLHERYIVCKPATREWTYIPNPRTRFWACATAVVARPSGPHDYRIFRFSRLRKDPWFLRCEVFDSRRWAWRRLRYVKMDPAVLLDRTPVYANGALNWLITSEYYSSSILSFDVRGETWESVMLPEGVRAPGEHSFLSTCDGRLCLTHHDEGERKVEIWVKGKKTWEAARQVDMEPILRENRVNHVWPVGMYTSRYMVAQNGLDLFWYDINGREQCRSRVVKDVAYRAQRMFMFESDLEQSNFGAAGTNLSCHTTSTSTGALEEALGYMFCFLFVVVTLIVTVKITLS